MAKKKSIIARMDTKARKIVRLRDECCQKCGEIYNLECAHIIIRRYYIARWDLWNLILLCRRCHGEFDSNPAAGMKWFQEKFPARFDYIAGLKIRRKSEIERTRTWRDSDLKEIEDFLTEKLADLENNS